MKRIITCILLCTSLTVFGQEAKNDNTTKLTIAVANPFINDLPNYNSQKVAKIIQLELIKLDKYSVLDEFDISELLQNNSEFSENCYGLNCLTKMGQQLNADYVISGRIDGLPGKIAISLKQIDVKNQRLHKSIVREFDDQNGELQRMLEILLKELHQVEPEKELVDRLKFKNEVITSNNVGRINNSGPRVGYALMTGSLNEFALRDRNQGGLDIFPGVSMIGYQVEKQYVGTENFSALIEGVMNISGLEQGAFIPSISLLNGFRFGKAGWEVAFGPGFGLKRVSNGFFDSENLIGRGNGYYYSEDDWSNYLSSIGAENDSAYIDVYGNYNAPSPSEYTGNNSYFMEENLDRRGSYKLTTSWVFAFGRTFKSGALNIPVNVFYSSTRGGGMVGLSVGFNVLKSKSPINRYK